MNENPILLKIANTERIIYKKDISKLEIISSLDSPYITSKLEIINRDDEYFNLIYAGLPINYEIDYDSFSVILPMRVISFDKIPRENPDSADLLDITLIHSFYFNNHFLTKAYFGSTAEIIKSVLFSEGISSFKTNIFPTDDRPVTRYRLQETVPVFLERISNYGRKNKTPCFLYMDPLNRLNLKSIYDFKNQTEGTFALAKTVVNNRDVPKNLLHYNILEMEDYHIFSNLENCSSTENVLLSTANFTTREPLINIFNMNNNELYNEQIQTMTPRKTTYMSWEYLPTDAYSLSLKNYFNLNKNAFTAIILFDDFLLKEACPGYLFRLILPGNPINSNITNKKVNLGEGGYVVGKSILSYDSSSGSPYSTKIYLISPN